MHIAPTFLPPRMTARIEVSIIFAKGVGPEETPLLFDKNDPLALNLVRDTPKPPEDLERISISDTDLAICSIVSWTSRRKQFDRAGFIVPAARFVEPPGIYSRRDILL